MGQRKIYVSFSTKISFLNKVHISSAFMLSKLLFLKVSRNWIKTAEILNICEIVFLINPFHSKVNMIF